MNPHRHAQFQMLFLLVGCQLPLACSGDSSPSPSDSPSTAKASSRVSDSDIDRSLEAAEAYFSAGRLDESEAILQVLTKKAPSEWRAYEALALVYLSRATDARNKGNESTWRSHATRVYELYKAAIAALPNDSSGLHQSAGEVAHTLGRSDEALTHYLRAAAIDRFEPKHAIYAAQVYLAREQWSEAIAQLQAALEIDPDEPYAFASLAQADMGQGRLDLALDHIRKARLLVPNDLAIRTLHATILRRSDRPRDALDLLVGLSSVHRAEEFVTAEIAQCYLAIDQPIDAARAWQHCYQTGIIGPRAWFAAVKAGECLLSSGEREQAWMWLEQAMRYAPNKDEVRALEAAVAATDPASD